MRECCPSQRIGQREPNTLTYGLFGIFLVLGVRQNADDTEIIDIESEPAISFGELSFSLLDAAMRAEMIGLVP